jgi:hypothetical protein
MSGDRGVGGVRTSAGPLGFAGSASVSSAQADDRKSIGKRAKPIAKIKVIDLIGTTGTKPV